jgi:Family of unknown function (DUF6412)
VAPGEARVYRRATISERDPVPGYIELLLRLIAIAVEIPDTGIAILILAGFVVLAGGAIILVARSVLALVSAAFGAAPDERTADATGIPQLSIQSAPDAAGRPQPRAPGRGVPVASP